MDVYVYMHINKFFVWDFKLEFHVGGNLNILLLNFFFSLPPEKKFRESTGEVRVSLKVYIPQEKGLSILEYGAF